ncbi:MAG TPA: hypothetical protein VEJ36_01935 [Nitrososphaerales archaeon]|nr:hypothetical protein [Nitrososphaerales archaeon]
MASKLVLDMKALALLNPSDKDLQKLVTENLLDSHDDQVRRVLDSIKSVSPRKGEGNVVIAVGELLLASFLMIAGLVAIAPFLAGVSSPSTLLQYFSSSIGTLATSPAFFPVLPELVVLLSVVLLMSALYALRKASATLKEQGFASR